MLRVLLAILLTPCLSTHQTPANESNINVKSQLIYSLQLLFDLYLCEFQLILPQKQCLPEAVCIMLTKRKDMLSSPHPEVEQRGQSMEIYLYPFDENEYQLLCMCSERHWR